jgi:hypothetical protein
MAAVLPSASHIALAATGLFTPSGLSKDSLRLTTAPSKCPAIRTNRDVQNTLCYRDAFTEAEYFWKPVQRKEIPPM